VAEKLIPTIAERDLRNGVRVKVAHDAPRERTKDLDPCARVGRLPRWWDELAAMGSTEVKFGIITPIRRSESFLSSRIFSCVIAECTAGSCKEYSFSLHLLSCAYLWPFCGQNSHKSPLLATISCIQELTLRVS